MVESLTKNIVDEHQRLVAEITPVGIDVIAKVITRSRISTIHIKNYTLYGIKTQKDNRFTIIRSNLSSILVQPVNLRFSLNRGNLKMISNIKGNHNTLIFDNPTTYFFTNGDSTSLITKAKPQKFDDLLPMPQNTLKQQTNKCRQIAGLKGKGEFGDIFIYGNQIVMVHLPTINAFMSLASISTAGYVQREPDLRLRSYFLFHVLADEAVLEIIFHKNGFWLRTETQFTQDITIEQFEPLQRIK